MLVVVLPAADALQIYNNCLKNSAPLHVLKRDDLGPATTMLFLSILQDERSQDKTAAD